MAKRVKKARVRYDNGKESGQEKYILEIWDNETGSWGTMMATRFVTDYKHPETGDEFVHYTLVTNIIQLVNQGYEVDI